MLTMPYQNKTKMTDSVEPMLHVASRRQILTFIGGPVNHVFLTVTKIHF